VLQADGGTRTAAICGAYVALHDAIAALMDAGTIAASPLLSPCAAVSVGLVGGDALLDLCYEEDVVAGVDMNVVMNGDGALIEVQGCAEGEPFTRDQMNQMLDLAGGGIAQIVQAQKEALNHG
jgi:ribonuclease PH